MQSKDILLNHRMKCCNSAFNAQGSRIIIAVVQVRAVKIYVAAVEALRKKERQDETRFTTKIHGFLSFIRP
jgi:predicted oxidoreductase (fatty acid repression mutant protein)